MRFFKSVVIEFYFILFLVQISDSYIEQKVRIASNFMTYSSVTKIVEDSKFQ